MLKLKNTTISKLIYASSVLLIFVGLYLVLHHNSKPPANGLTSTEAPPKTNKISRQEIDNYKVDPDEPRYLYIPSLKIDKTRVTHLGVNKNGQIAVPTNIYDTGWYRDSSKPGQAGAVFIYGHISSWQANGIFYNLHKLKIGDEVSVERGDGKKFNYSVVKIKTYDHNHVDMGEVLSPIKAGKQGLNLMTCAGKVIKGTSEFSQRLVVFTTLK